MEDLDRAGGVYAVMKELADAGLLHTDVMTCTGKTMAENIAHADNLNPEIIRPMDNPYMATGGIAVLFGNLAPRRLRGQASRCGTGNAGTHRPCPGL